MVEDAVVVTHKALVSVSLRPGGMVHDVHPAKADAANL